MDLNKFGNFNWIEMEFKRSESGFNTNKTNPFLSISIHFLCWEIDKNRTSFA